MVAQIILFATIYYAFWPIDCDEQRQALFNSLYFSVVTWTTLGYGDIQPDGWARGVAALEALFGYVYTPLFIGLVITSLYARASR